MRKYWFMQWLGFRYLLDTKTNTIHDLERVHSLCNRNTIPKKNRKYISETDYINSIKLYSNCQYCNKIKS